MKLSSASFKKYLNEQIKLVLEKLDDEDASFVPPTDLGKLDSFERSASAAAVDDSAGYNLTDGVDMDALAAREYQKLNPRIAALAATLNEVQIASLNTEIDNVRKTGRGKITHISAMRGVARNLVPKDSERGQAIVGGTQAPANKSKIHDFNYVTTVLASIFQVVDEQEKANIRDYMFVAFSPVVPDGSKLEPSAFAVLVAKRANLGVQLSFSKNRTTTASDYMSYVEDGIYKAISHALPRFRANESANFFSFLLTSAANAAKTVMRSDRMREVNKEKIWLQTPAFLEDPLGSGEEEGGSATMLDRLADTSPDLDINNHNREDARAIANAIHQYLEKHVPNFAYFFEDYVLKGLTYDEISADRGISQNTLRQHKFKLAKILQKLAQDYRFDKYIQKVTGLEYQSPESGFPMNEGAAPKARLLEEKHLLAIRKFVLERLKECE